MQSSTTYSQDINANDAPPPERKIVLDKNGDYIVPKERMAIMWGYIKFLEDKEKYSAIRIAELENLARVEAANRMAAEQDAREKTIIIRVVAISAGVLIGGAIVFGVVSK